MTMHTLRPGGAPPPAGRRRNPMVALIAGVFAAYIVTNGIMLFVAMRSPPTLVSKSYYEDSRRYDAVQSAEQASQAAGWRVEALPPAPAEVVLRILDRAGRPASGFSGAVTAYRPNDPALDQALAWSEDPRSPGQYQAAFARPHAGQWRIHLALRRGGERLDHDLRIVCP
jgi:nitrogen fixation protein FixH